MLHINDLTYRIGGRTLFEQATVVVPAGHKVGLVGKNGTGKSTLFKLILEEAQPDQGSLTIQKRATVGRVAQEAPTGSDSLLQTVLKADTEREALLAEAETATDPHRIGEIHARLADIEAHSAPSRAATILQGLGFDHEAQQRPCSDFSGGWQMRVALAAALFAKPDLLLLDEPTNHLDLEAVMWLEDYLKKYQGTILIISHERTLLNNVVNEIVHLEHCKLTRYGGNYDVFEKTRREKLELLAKAQSKQLAQRKHLQSFVDRFRAKASKAKQAQSRLKMLERMEPIASVMEEKTYTFNFPDPEPLSSPLIAMEDASVGYGETPILKKLSLRIDMDDRIALLGANGNGKSTLIKLLSSRLVPMDGKMRKSSKLKVGYFAQHQTDELNTQKTPFDHMAALMPDAVESKVRAQLGRFGFEGDKGDTKIEKLSGGEKARLLFALMSYEAPHLMFLDEPTNHLDVDSREALVQAINTYDGAVVMVSHDPHLLELTCDRLWIVDGGTCQPFEGDLDEYKRLLIESRRGEKKSGSSSNDESATNAKKANRQDRAAQRAAQAPLRKKAKEAEKRVEKYTAEKEKLEVQLADPKIYEGPSDKLQALQIKLGEINAALEEAEMEWLEAAEALEEA